MKTRKQNLLAVIISSLCLIFVSSMHVEGQEEESNETIIDSLRRKTPSGQYVDPASFFRFHGYVSLSYAEPGEELGGLGGTPQILIGGPKGGFRNDSALFVGGEPFDGVSSVIELHFVGDASNPVITEAKLIWDIIESDEGKPFTFRLVGGRYWWPFGIHNDEWFSAVNRFHLLSPVASEVVPPHYNEVGIMAEGEIKLANRFGANYVFSVGNGVPGFELMPNVRGTTADTNSNRALTGRVGFVLQRDFNLEAGFSVAFGDLRDGPMVEAPTDPLHYAADFVAMGPDVVLKWKGVGLRGYYYVSEENLAEAPQDTLDRHGFTVEPSYTFNLESLESRYLKAITLLGRFSSADEDKLDGKTVRRLQYGIGANVDITNTFHAKLGYIIQGEEEDASEIDNDVFSVSLTAEF